ncbi:unnamed protein product [Prunus armeniaca]|uniref:Uncharacterized protein n=1 Tax=Prunus armeniaca TaxID=36596 RepID=A0A6J5TPI6_PRUAR|nr:unnamed protein product [Prunus armeniaca]
MGFGCVSKVHFIWELEEWENVDLQLWPNRLVSSNRAVDGKGCLGRGPSVIGIVSCELQLEAPPIALIGMESLKLFGELC